MQDKCCVVLISYNPTQEIIDNVEVLISQVPEILIVDNGSNPDSLCILEKLSKNQSVNVKYNSTNLGIATALNQGVHYAAENGYDWVVTFDQDSLAPSNYIQTMIKAYQSYEQSELIAIIAPRYETNTGIISFSKEDTNNKTLNVVKTTITSGNIVRIKALEDVGFFDDSFFIDYVDHEFCLRARSKGWLITESYQSILLHSLGNSTLHKIGNISIVTTGHSPIRRYYKYRNLIVTLKRYYWFEPLMLLVDLKAIIFEPLRILLFEKDKFSKLLHIFKGVVSGITCR
jgi:rhamnosyltransferase